MPSFRDDTCSGAVDFETSVRCQKPGLLLLVGGDRDDDAHGPIGRVLGGGVNCGAFVRGLVGGG